jgi:hypothetical protein
LSIALIFLVPVFVAWARERAYARTRLRNDRRLGKGRGCSLLLRGSLEGQTSE